MANKEYDERLPMGLVFLCLPLGFAIWYVPLMYVDTLGLLTSVSIIIGIIACIIIIRMILPKKHPLSRPRIDNSRDREPKTYMV